MIRSAYLAHHRFGLGARLDAPAMPADPVPVLMAQLAAFERAPAAIAGLANRSALAQEFFEYRERVRAARPGGTAAGNMPAMAEAAAPAMAAAPEMAGANRPRRMAAMPGIGSEVMRLRRHYVAAAGVRVQLAATTSAPFPERLVHFWQNHFAISLGSQPVMLLAGDYEFRAIRPHIMGRFADLLKAAVLHPAMLVFLDQAQSVGPGSQLAQRRNQRSGRGEGPALGLNENLAREILELHTLGVRSGYAQADVTAFARAMTGWTVAGPGGRGGRIAEQLAERAGMRLTPGDTVFVNDMHEPGAQTIIGTRFADDGRAQSLAILDHLAAQPATARHIATKLARHFSADVPAPALVDRLTKAFLDSGGDLPTLYNVLLTSPESWQTDQPKFKSAWDWTISALRATGVNAVDTTGGGPAGRRGATGILDQLGQPIWAPGSPAGYDDVTERWAGPAALMTRAEVASRLAAGTATSRDPVAQTRLVLADAADAAAITAISRADSPAQGMAMMLLTPSFLRR